MKDKQIMNRKERLQLAIYGSILDAGVLFAKYGRIVHGNMCSIGVKKAVIILKLYVLKQFVILNA